MSHGGTFSHFLLRRLGFWTIRTFFLQVHVCLFLIPHSALPLPAEVLALLKRLRAVACMLPLLVVQHTTSCEQILRE